jgi:hypothetical protein
MSLPVRRNRKASFVAGSLLVLHVAWTVITTTIDAANLPSDANDAWKAIVTAHEFIPAGFAMLTLSLLVWSLLPPKGARPQPTQRTEGGHGIHADEDAIVTVIGGRISDNRGSGVHASGRARVRIDSTPLQANGDDGNKNP